MKRLLGLGWILASFTVVGCGSNPRDGLISTTIEHMSDAASKVASIKDRIGEAVKKAEKEKKDPDFKEAIIAAESLKKTAKDLQALKLETEKLKGGTSEEESKELAKRWKDKLNAVEVRLYTELTELRKVMKEVESQNKDALKELRAKINEADGEFVVSSRR